MSPEEPRRKWYNLRVDENERYIGGTSAVSRAFRPRGGAWYRADLRTGETMAMPTNALVVGKDGNSSIKALWIDKLEFSRVSSGAVR